MTTLTELTGTELIERFRSGEVSPTDAVRAAIQQADRTEPAINAVITRTDELALAAAAESDRRYRDGTARPLEGVPIGIKDIIATAGVRTTAGSAIYRDWVPDYDATVTQRLRDAGAVIVAKHAPFPFALGSENNPHYGPTLNPWDTERTPGGSSSGSGASVAARQVPISIGTDTGGSIRLPATWCGVSGLKPTWGRVPNRGVMPLAWSMDTVGPLARSVADLALVLDVIAGHDPADASSSRHAKPDFRAELDKGVAGLRIGLPENWFLEKCDPQIVAAVEDAAERFTEAGATIVPVRFPHAELTQAIGWFTILGELASLHQITVDRLDEYDSGFAGHIVNGLFVSATDYLRCQRLRSLIQADYELAFRECDAILVPGNSSYAPKLADMMCQVGDTEYFWYEVAARCTFSFNITGLPTVAVPAGLGFKGLPLGIQIAAPPFREDLALRITHAYQQMTDHHRLAPPLVHG